MERILKFGIITLLFMAFATAKPVFAVEQMNLSTLITAQNVKYENCTKVFNTDNISLLYLTIAAVNANRFSIDEIQSKSGYVLFTAVNKRFLATVTNVNTKQAMLKITPEDNNYFFQPGIVLNVFKYIELNLGEKLQNIPLN